MRKSFFSFVAVVFCVFCLNAQNLTVATFNVRNDSNTEDAKNGNGWSQRYPYIAQMILFNGFDVLGAQEVLHHQLNDLLGSLPGYDYIGVGRDDGKTTGEYAPIFYKKDKVELIKTGNFWLSQQTEFPNKGWDAVLPRICTWGEFKDKDGKFRFWFFNLHMDHVGVIARQESAKLVLSKIKEMCGNDPVILTGDFNVDQTHESYRLLNESGVLNDSFEKAQIRYALNGTFNAWDPDLKTDSRIDHVFVTNSFVVNKYGVLTDTYRSPRVDSKTVQSGNFPKEVSLKEYDARLLSDHFPVRVELTFDKKKK